MFSYKLDSDFVAQYANVEPNWGYKDAAGNSVGEITFLRTYSRIKDDGTKEQWYEVCERVINGMYSIQKDYARANRLPWDESKAHDSAEEAFERMFSFKWTPPGRGLWVMGTPLVMEHKNSAPLQNCFGGAETLLTEEYGVVSFEDIAGETVTVATRNGWEKAEARQFGVQPVQRVTFAPAGPNPRGEGFRTLRSNVRRDVVATPNHRWELTDGSVTDFLGVGDSVPASATTADKTSAEYLAGLRHGIIFGDGSRGFAYANGDHDYVVRLCGDKNRLADYFERVTYVPSSGDDPHAHIRSARDLKAFPSGDSVDYVSGFLDGWIECDASDSPTGSKVLASGHPGAGDWLEKYSALGGWVMRGENKDSTTETNYGVRNQMITRFVLCRPSTDVAWKVTAIEKLDEEVPVYCVTVPDTERFTLSAGIYSANCAFISTGDMTKSNPSEPFVFMMEALMLGVGVGFDLKGADHRFTIQDPERVGQYVIPDTREGWVDSLGMILDAFLHTNSPLVEFDYSAIRPAGEPIRTFGGTASGPGPLRDLHERVKAVFEGRAGETLTTMDILDIGNLIGTCVVAGNVRRSAELALGSIDDDAFLNAKNAELFPVRNSYDPDAPGWAWMSNNSVSVKVGDDLAPIAEGIARNGEPGVIWLDVAQEYGRLADAPDYKDWRVAGFNPCAEQSLESYEMCTLVETYLGNHDSVEDFERTLKFAYLYAKTVTLLPTHWERTNGIMQRNRRIGTSVSGVADFVDRRGHAELRRYLDEGYETIEEYDKIYSEWLGIRPSIKTTTVKPSGTVSILAGESPGVHWSPGGRFFERRIRFSNDDPMLKGFRAAGYLVEPASESPATTSVVAFPIESKAARAEKDVTIFEKIDLAAQLQHWWSDNSVSVTVSFDPETEGKHIGSVLAMYEGRLKTVSFLPMMKGTYPQMPYTEIAEKDFVHAGQALRKMDLSPVYNGEAKEAAGEAFCTTDGCEITTIKNTLEAK